MPVKTANAALVSTATILTAPVAVKRPVSALTARASVLAVTGFIPYQSGTVDPLTNTVKANGSSRWLNLQGTTWAATTRYVTEFEPIKWTAPIIDLDSVKYFTLAITSVFQGTMSYDIYVSQTGLFQGEEDIYRIQEGDTGIASFYGQFCYVTATITGQEFSSINITPNTSTREILLPNINSGTLSGSNTARQIPLGGSVSLIKDIQIQVKTPTAYAVDLYVSSTATSQVIIPMVVSKSSTAPTFALYGIDNQPRDAVVDIQITALPQMVMLEGNILVV
jgi:hypothetical protein